MIHIRARLFGSDGQSRAQPEARKRAFVVPALLILIAFLYYGQYYNYGFNYADEGNIALISQRIFEGEIPYKDIAVAAGLLWPYSIAFLFWLFGVDFIAMKVYFFCLATVTALLGYATVIRLGSRKWLGFIAGLLLVLLPGSIHKIFIPLAIVANMYFLSRIDLEKESLGLSQTIGAAIVLAFTFLLRGDLGLCASVAFVGLTSYHTVSRPRPLQKALYANARALGLAVGAFALVLLPFFILASLQGFLHPFTIVVFGKLMHFFAIVRNHLMIPRGGTQSPDIPSEVGALLERIPIAATWKADPLQLWAILTYLPLLVFSIALLILFASVIRRWLRGLPLRTNADVSLLLIFFLALGAFPQFFLERPDVAHLSQFMPGYTIFIFVLIDRCLPKRRIAAIPEKKHVYNFILRKRELPGLLGAAALVLNLGIYAWGGLRHASTGSIARKSGHTELFEAENGVRVYLAPHTHAGLTRVKTLVEKHAAQDDFVVCFPYAPGFNFMTNRRTFMRQLYADDSWLIGEPDWQERTLNEMRTKKPPIVIIEDYPINGTEISRFPNWATEVCAYVAANYDPMDNVIGNTVYVRRDILNRQDARLAQ
jgi:hypothetical protein